MEVARTWVSIRTTGCKASSLLIISTKIVNIFLLYDLSFLFLTVSGTKVFVMPGGMMKSNGNLVDLIEKVKPEIRTLIEKCNTVSMKSNKKS